MQNVDTLPDDELKRRVVALIDTDDWSEECITCGVPSLLHRGTCTRSNKEPPEERLKIWSSFNTRMRSILRWIKLDQKKELEAGFLLEGLKNLCSQISEQNTGNLKEVLDAMKEDKGSVSDGV